MISSYQKALNLGYSDEDIFKHFQSKDPEFEKKYQTAISHGYKPEEIFSHLSKPKKELKSKEFPLENENDLERDIERNQARTLSRGIETIAGLPGDIESFARSIFGFENDTFLPTSSELQKKSENLTRGYTRPQSEFEEKSDELTKDIASFMLPGSNSYNLARNLGIPIVGNLVKEGLSYVNADDKFKSGAKVGTMIFLDLLSQRKGAGGGARNFASNLFNKFKKELPDGIAESSILENSLNKLEETLKSGGERPSTGEALKKIDEIRKEISNGKVPIKKLVPFRESINEIIDSFGGYDYMKLPPKIRQRTINNLQQVKGAVINSVEDFLEKSHPESADLWKSANEAFAAYENSNKISNFMKKTFGNAIKSNTAKALLGLGGTGISGAATYLSPALTAGAGAAGGVGSLGYQAFKIIHRMWNSPTLRKYYFNILEGATKGNSSQVARNLKPLDKELLKQEKDQSVE